MVGYAHLDTEWRWEYPQVIDEYIRKTMEDNFKLFEKYPHYVFNFSGANRYRLMKEYFPADFAKVKSYVDQGRWFPAGSSMEEGDVNAPSAEAIIRQILYGNNWFRKEFGKASAEYMLPDCFGFPASLPTILAHSGVRASRRRSWSGAPRRTPADRNRRRRRRRVRRSMWAFGWGRTARACSQASIPGSYSGGIETDLSKPLPPAPPNAALEDIAEEASGAAAESSRRSRRAGQAFDQKDSSGVRSAAQPGRGIARSERDQDLERYQGDWAARVEQNGKVSGVFTDYHYYGTGDIGGAPDEDSVKRLEAIVTKGTASLPPAGSS